MHDVTFILLGYSEAKLRDREEPKHISIEETLQETRKNEQLGALRTEQKYQMLQGKPLVA